MQEIKDIITRATILRNIHNVIDTFPYSEDCTERVDFVRAIIEVLDVADIKSCGCFGVDASGDKIAGFFSIDAFFVGFNKILSKHLHDEKYQDLFNALQNF